MLQVTIFILYVDVYFVTFSFQVDIDFEKPILILRNQKWVSIVVSILLLIVMSKKNIIPGPFSGFPAREAFHVLKQKQIISEKKIKSPIKLAPRKVSR